MDVLEAIKTRVSIRDYKPDPVPEHLIDEILEAGRRAPSGLNMQPWRFIVIRNPELRAKIGELAVVAAVALFKPKTAELERRFIAIPEEKRAEVVRGLTTGARFKFVGEAPVLIAVAADTSETEDYDLSTAAAIENMLLAAHGLGLGACWVGLPVSKPEFRDHLAAMLGLPEHIKPRAVISLGYPSRVPKLRPRLDIEKIVSYERYGNHPRGAPYRALEI
jgi:nitroreductase